MATETTEIETATRMETSTEVTGTETKTETVSQFPLRTKFLLFVLFSRSAALFNR